MNCDPVCLCNDGPLLCMNDQNKVEDKVSGKMVAYSADLWFYKR